MATSQGDHNIGYAIQNGLFGVEHPAAHIPAEGGFSAGVWPSPFAEVLKALMEGRDAKLPAFANIPARTWVNGTARELAAIKAALEGLSVPPVEVDYAQLAEALRPVVAEECEAAVRKVLGGLDGATPAA